LFPLFNSEIAVGSSVLFLNPLAFCRAYFLRTQLGKHPKPAFAFSQAYIFHVSANFFTSNLESQHSVSALSTTNFFSASYLRRRHITRCSPVSG